jgi:DnaJ-class molecular chaperone
MGPMIQQIQSHCGNCRGSGKISIPNNICNECNAEGFKICEAQVGVPLKSGLSNGQQIQLQHMGHNLKDGKTDIIIVIHEKEHKDFKRDGNNLILNIELKLFQALFGFDKIIKHLDNRELYISHTGITDYGTKKKICGEGMADLKTKVKGDIIINFTFKLPIINKPDIIQNLQYNLKTINQEESNNEVEIRVNNSKYVKTIMMDYKKEDEEQHQQQHQQQHHHQHHFHQQFQHVNVEGGQPQCVHQ